MFAPASFQPLSFNSLDDEQFIKESQHSNRNEHDQIFAEEERYLYLFRHFNLAQAEVYRRDGKQTQALASREEIAHIMQEFLKERAKQYKEGLSHPSLFKFRFLFIGDVLSVGQAEKAMRLAKVALVMFKVSALAYEYDCDFVTFIPSMIARR